MIERDFVIQHEVGLHARPASRFTQVAGKYRSEVRLIKDGKIANGKSLLSILAMGIFKGARIKIQVVGPDEIEAMYNLKKLLDSDFMDDDV